MAKIKTRNLFLILDLKSKWFLHLPSTTTAQPLTLGLFIFEKRRQMGGRAKKIKRRTMIF